MNSKKIFAIGFAFVIIVVAIVVILSIGGNPFSNDDTVDINIYFLNPVTKKITPEKRTVKNGEPIELFNKVVEEILAGPKNNNMVSVIPQDVKILKCTLITGGENGNTAEIDFSKEYKELKESQELFCRASVVWTLTELEFIDNVNILIEGQPLLRENGEQLGILNRANVIIDPVISPDKTNPQEIILYFSDEMAMGLCEERRSIDAKQNQPIEVQIVEQLIKGPENKKLEPTVPSETKVRNIKTEDGICYVDLSNDFINKHNGGSTGELLSIYSIVNSLTELDNVKKVQFFIEGEKVSTIKGHIDFSKTFERDESMILDENS